MGRTKGLLPEHWHEYQEQMHLYWMEQEYFGKLAKQNRKKKSYDKLQKQEKESHLESERPYFQTPYESHEAEQGISRTRPEANLGGSEKTEDDF